MPFNYSLTASDGIATMTKKLSTIQAGVTGEYFVAAELSRRGYIASLTLRNTRGIDVLEFPGFSGHPVGATCEPLRTARGSPRRDDYGGACDCRTCRCRRPRRPPQALGPC